MGWRFEHLAEVLSRAGDAGRLGLCLDTCHLFAAGYDLSTEAGYHEVMSECDRGLGLERVHRTRSRARERSGSRPSAAS
jgi:deoxyribonuclease-4